MKATFLGHAAAYLEFDNTRIVIDPFLTGNPKAGAKADDLDPDFIVVTHGHGDHVGDTLAIAKRTGATVVSTYELALWLENQGAQVSAQNHGVGAGIPLVQLSSHRQSIARRRWERMEIRSISAKRPELSFRPAGK